MSDDILVEDSHAKQEDEDIHRLVEKTGNISVTTQKRHKKYFSILRDREREIEHYMNLTKKPIAPWEGVHKYYTGSFHGLSLHEVLDRIQALRRESNEYYELANDVILKLANAYRNTRFLLQNVDDIFQYIEDNLQRYTGISDDTIPKHPIYFDEDSPEFLKGPPEKPTVTPYMKKCKEFYSRPLDFKEWKLDVLQHKINEYAKQYKSNASLTVPPDTYKKTKLQIPNSVTRWLKQCIYIIMEVTNHRALTEIFYLNKIKDSELTNNQKQARKLLAQLVTFTHIGGHQRRAAMGYVLAASRVAEINEW